MAEPKQPTTSDAPKDARAPDAVQEEAGPFGKAWYWSILAFSLVALFTSWIYYNSGLAFWIQLFYFGTILICLILLAWSLIGLLRSHHVVSRLGASAQRFRANRDAADDQDGPIVYRENIVVRLFKFGAHLVALLFLFVWNTVLRIVYIIEVTVIRALILGYDLIYYVGYAAWAIAYWALRIALKLSLWALRVAWKVLRILTRLPVAKGIWSKRMRPKILAAWQRRVDHYRQRAATRLDQKRRLVAAKGKDPDVWQRDWQAHHQYPLPHPHEARKGLRARITERQKLDFNRRDRWRAYRKGLPIPPKIHSERKMEREAEEQRLEAERKSEPREPRRGRTTPRRNGEPGALDGERAPEERGG